MFTPTGRRFGTETFDGLRGIAIGWVIFYHSWLFSFVGPSIGCCGHSFDLGAFARTGYLGVDLFFFISGFCLFHPHVRALMRGSRLPTLAYFFTQRARKILPSYVIALVVAACLTRTYFSTVGEWWQAIGVHLAFIHNVWPDWFGQANSVFWSLAIEVQFYLAFPLIAWAMRRYPIQTLATLVVVGQAFRNGSLGFIDDEQRVRVLLGYIDVFASGMAAAYVLEWLRQRRTAWTTGNARWLWTLVAALAGYACVALVYQLADVDAKPHGREIWEATHRAQLTACFALLALGTQLGLAWWRRAIVNPLTVGLSTISYNLYLWHTPIQIWLYRNRVPTTNFADPHSDPHWGPLMLAIALPLTVVLCIGLTYGVELPLMRWGRKSASKAAAGVHIDEHAGASLTRATRARSIPEQPDSA